MRVNVYTEEFEFDRPEIDIVVANYTAARTGHPARNYGLRFYLKSPPELHHTEKDDDRSAVTFWCGPDIDNCVRFLNMAAANAATIANLQKANAITEEQRR